MSPAPSSAHDWPISVRRYLTHLCLQLALDRHDGSWRELAESLYAGRLRANGERMPYAPNVDAIWEIIMQDAADWNASRTSPSPTPS